MILKYAEHDFSFENKTEIKDELGNILFTTIYDFSYKGRVRIFDDSGNDNGYVQFKILSINDEVGFFDKDNKQLAAIKIPVSNINEIDISLLNWKILGDIKKCKLVDSSDSVIMSVQDNTINIVNDKDAILCIMCMVILGNTNRLEI